jgi:polyisoprenoid-binding protein YceI
MRTFIHLVPLTLALSLRAFADPAPAPTPAQAGPAQLAIKPEASSVTYHIVHKLHRVDGVSKRVEGRARLQAAGPTQVAIRVPVDSFDSGNVNRDAHMKEAVEAARYPLVELKAVADGVAAPATYPGTVQKTWHAQITFHGITQQLDIPVTLRFDAADRVVATTSFQVSLESFKVERPSLMFVKIDDAMKIDASLTFAP